MIITVSILVVLAITGGVFIWWQWDWITGECQKKEEAKIQKIKQREAEAEANTGLKKFIPEANSTNYTIGGTVLAAGVLGYNYREPVMNKFGFKTAAQKEAGDPKKTG